MVIISKKKTYSKQKLISIEQIKVLQSKWMHKYLPFFKGSERISKAINTPIKPIIIKVTVRKLITELTKQTNQALMSLNNHLPIQIFFKLNWYNYKFVFILILKEFFVANIFFPTLTDLWQK